MLHCGVAAYHGEINNRVSNLNYSEALIYPLVNQVVLVDEHPLQVQPNPRVVRPHLHHRNHSQVLLAASCCFKMPWYSLVQIWVNVVCMLLCPGLNCCPSLPSMLSRVLVRLQDIDAPPRLAVHLIFDLDYFAWAVHFHFLHHLPGKLYCYQYQYFENPIGNPVSVSYRYFGGFLEYLYSLKTCWQPCILH